MPVADYVGYTGRTAVARSGAGFTVTGNVGTGFTAANAAKVEFPTCTGGAGNTIVAVEAYSAATDGKFLGSAVVNIAVVENSQPQSAIGALEFTTPVEGLSELLFQNTTMAGIGDVTGLVASSAAGSIFLELIKS